MTRGALRRKSQKSDGTAVTPERFQRTLTKQRNSVGVRTGDLSAQAAMSQMVAWPVDTGDLLQISRHFR